MSLINEALKKAQHQRSGPMDAPPMPGGGGHRGGSGMPKGTIVLLIAAATVVVVLSVVATVYFVNRAPTPKVAATPAGVELGPITIPNAAPAPVPAASPVIIAPVIVHASPLSPVEPPPTQTPTPAPPSTAPAGQTTDASVSTTPVPTAAKDAAVVPAASTPPVAAAEPVVEGSLEDRIATYLDKLRVTGIRTSDSGSKVLMNDKVYRLNDMVNRTLGLRLTKIASDSLTFEDAKGASYVKSF